jgi:hypothetical protein
LAAYRRSHEAFDNVSRSEVSGDGSYKRLVISRLAELGGSVGDTVNSSQGATPHGNEDSK